MSPKQTRTKLPRWTAEDLESRREVRDDCVLYAGNYRISCNYLLHLAAMPNRRGIACVYSLRVCCPHAVKFEAHPPTPASLRNALGSDTTVLYCSTVSPSPACAIDLSTVTIFHDISRFFTIFYEFSNLEPYSSRFIRIYHKLKQIEP